MKLTFNRNSENIVKVYDEIQERIQDEENVVKEVKEIFSNTFCLGSQRFSKKVNLISRINYFQYLHES